ncbi:MAG: PEP-CTERM sorting domain-containing protein [Gemmataceae bacterium]
MICSRWIALALVLLPASTTKAQIAYTITDLGFLPGIWNSSFAHSINNAGQVAGDIMSMQSGMPANRAWRYTPGVGLIDLGSLGTSSVSTSLASQINSSGQVVGDSSLPSGVVGGAYRYTSGVGMVGLGTLPGHNYSKAMGINDAGQVVGESGIGGMGPAVAFRYTDGVGMVSLGMPPGAVSSQGQAINNVGQVVVNAAVPLGTVRTFRYTDALGFLTLGTLGGQNTVGFAINDAGQIVGYSETAAGETHAFRYSDGFGIVDLGTVAGTSGSLARGMNNQGDVVGQSGTRAFLFRDGLGMADLNGLIDPTSGWFLQVATDINENGQIAGFGTLGGITRAFVLTPVPEPSSLLLVAAFALAGAVAHHRRRIPTWLPRRLQRAY